MLFDYAAFVEELRGHENPEKRKIMERWAKISSAQSIEEEPYYAYLSKFKLDDLSFKVPEELSDDFDWHLLFQLVAGSFSSDYQLCYPNPDDSDEFDSENELPELYITVTSGNASVTKTLSELWSFQILRLFEIYIEEQMNLHALKCEDKQEEDAIDMEREMRLKKFHSRKREYLLSRNTLKQRITRKRLLDSVD